ncbi:MAG: FAD-dependent oxidoreductase, partial [Chloroflexi bacterium]|nr:FAD-dependent oxidoreductase [Chloroflexota bacterium]
LEKRPYVGGRAVSFQLKDTGQQVDNGQHVFMGCCTYYVDFLRKLGVHHKAHMQKRLKVPIIDVRGRMSALASSPLPAPFHLLPSFLRYRHLSIRDRLMALYAVACILLTSPKRRSETDGLSFGQWLRSHGQSKKAIARFWDLLVLATLNGESEAVSASMALMVFQEGFLKTAHGADIGYATVGLSELLSREAKAYIEARGGRVCTGTRAERLLGEDSHVDALQLADGTTISAHCYVCTVPYHELLKLLPDGWRRQPFFAKAEGLSASPIVNAHVWYDRPVTDLDFAAFLDSDVQWLFNKSKMLRQAEHGPQYICVSLSGAEKYVGMSKQGLRDLLIPQLASLLPAAGDALVVDFTVTREWQATFAVAPGSAQHRLPVRTPIENLFLAGDWTDTGWPPTMESAVRSGVACAREIARVSA